MNLRRLYDEFSYIQYTSKKFVINPNEDKFFSVKVKLV